MVEVHTVHTVGSVQRSPLSLSLYPYPYVYLYLSIYISYSLPPRQLTS